ncbi:HPr kinase/phosphorylase [Varunaivibrio sulfuroxidans]|uniref:Hpr(Ser) kinase/phosphatase n=1 Tax=Varunaivibrio sulfuroxidans TaxID=1773489 RepID=A0A4R3J8G2_9PROT|nr:HPr kinase/phosphatase C-terminal domain-containing protein [Varunaivibrio sulfuroxidans]TCS61655.1 Hpr(Ser) kinase/phosphatase [Varunaivibrio sulfuroxidans]WES29474.1 HPr kinase/phosphatase C-terminal domain-containing protein [Varunaivibrio sulfuroxidans]
MDPVHASCVAIDGRAVLLVGPSGCGKSDLALRLLDQGAILVADDYTLLSIENDIIVARPPETIAGRIEVRGLGIVRVDHLPSAPLVAIFDLVDRETVERMPEREMCGDFGAPLAKFRLDPFAASATAKVRITLRTLDSALLED